MAEFWYPKLKKVWQVNPADYYSVLNEPAGNNPVVALNYFAYEERMMELAETDGYKLCILNLAGGTPGNLQTWKDIYVPHIHRGFVGGHIYGRHAYGDNSELVPIDGNSGRPFVEAAHLLKIGLGNGGIVITELGFNGGYGYVGDSKFMEEATAYDVLMGDFRNIIGGCMWTLGDNEFDANWQSAIPELTAYNIAHQTPQWVQGPIPPLGDGPPPPPPPPPPPSTGEVDTADYFNTPSGFGDIVILKNNWGQGDERTQLQSNGRWSYVVKNQQYEQRWIGDSKIYLMADTSPGNDQYYTIESKSGWMPRYAKVGDVLQRGEVVSHFEKNNCSPLGQNVVLNSIKFVDFHETWTSQGSVTLNNVMEWDWILDNGVVEETYFYAPHLGLVAWQKNDGKASYINELIPLGDQHNNVKEEISCLVVRPPDEGPAPIMRAEGVDVSKWQGVIDWNKMASRADFSFIRSSYGLTQDQKYQQNITGASSNGVYEGIYHYFMNNILPESQAQYFATFYNNDHALPPAVDIEDPKNIPSDLRNRVWRFLQSYEGITDVRPMIYTSPGYWNAWIGNTEWAKDYELWVAHWGAVRPTIPAGFTDWTFWQYTNKGYAADYGASSSWIDLDFFNGTNEELDEYVRDGQVDLLEALWDASLETQVLQLYPEAAFQKLIFAQGFVPVSNEWRETVNGIDYAVQTAESLSSGERRVYYTEVPNWGNIRFFSNG
jgi:lysozyme